MVIRTLRAIRRGGAFDQVGHGVHRHSTDAAWHLPHFEKMLYDQALLALAAVEAREASGTPEMGDLAEDVLDYVLRDLRHPEGGFCSAEGADSPGGARVPSIPGPQASCSSSCRRMSTCWP